MSQSVTPPKADPLVDPDCPTCKGKAFIRPPGGEFRECPQCLEPNRWAFLERQRKELNKAWWIAVFYIFAAGQALALITYYIWEKWL